MDTRTFEARLARSLREIGVSESVAATAARGRDGSRSGYDGLFDNFRALGLSVTEAQHAAKGRDESHAQARKAFDEATRRTRSQVQFDAAISALPESEARLIAESLSRRPGR